MRTRFENNSVRFNRVVFDALNHGLTRGAIHLSRFMGDGMQRLGRWQSSAPGTYPNRQTARLRNSIRAIPSTRLRSAAGAEAKRGLYMERGATITPKRVRAIAVPLNREARRLRESMKNLRNANLVAIKIRGRTFLCKPTQRGRKLEAMFVLRPFVRILPRPWARPSLYRNRAAIYNTVRNEARRYARTHAAEVGGRR